MPQDLKKFVNFFLYKSLSENIQMAEKYFFKSGKLNEEDKQLILSITKGDEMTFKIAEIYEERLDKPEESLLSYRRLLSIDPHNTNALSHINRLLDVAADNPEKISFLYEQVENASNIQEKLIDLQHLYDELGRKRGKSAALIDTLKKILSIDTTNSNARKNLA